MDFGHDTSLSVSQGRSVYFNTIEGIRRESEKTFVQKLKGILPFVLYGAAGART
jgi:hypothetical protein